MAFYLMEQFDSRNIYISILVEIEPMYIFETSSRGKLATNRLKEQIECAFSHSCLQQMAFKINIVSNQQIFQIYRFERNNYSSQ